MKKGHCIYVNDKGLRVLEKDGVVVMTQGQKLLWDKGKGRYEACVAGGFGLSETTTMGWENECFVVCFMDGTDYKSQTLNIDWVIIDDGTIEPNEHQYHPKGGYTSYPIQLT